MQERQCKMDIGHEMRVFSSETAMSEKSSGYSDMGNQYANEQLECDFSSPVMLQSTDSELPFGSFTGEMHCYLSGASDRSSHTEIWSDENVGNQEEVILSCRPEVDSNQSFNHLLMPMGYEYNNTSTRYERNADECKFNYPHTHLGEERTGDCEENASLTLGNCVFEDVEMPLLNWSFNTGSDSWYLPESLTSDKSFPVQNTSRNSNTLYAEILKIADTSNDYQVTEKCSVKRKVNSRRNSVGIVSVNPCSPVENTKENCKTLYGCDLLKATIPDSQRKRRVLRNRKCVCCKMSEPHTKTFPVETLQNYEICENESSTRIIIKPLSKPQTRVNSQNFCTKKQPISCNKQYKYYIPKNKNSRRQEISYSSVANKQGEEGIRNNKNLCLDYEKCGNVKALSVCNEVVENTDMLDNVDFSKDRANSVDQINLAKTDEPIVLRIRRVSTFASGVSMTQKRASSVKFKEEPHLPNVRIRKISDNHKTYENFTSSISKVDAMQIVDNCSKKCKTTKKRNENARNRKLLAANSEVVDGLQAYSFLDVLGEDSDLPFKKRRGMLKLHSQKTSEGLPASDLEVINSKAKNTSETQSLRMLQTVDTGVPSSKYLLRSKVVQHRNAHEHSDSKINTSSDSEAGILSHTNNASNEKANVLSSSISEIAQQAIDSTDVLSSSGYSLRSRVFHQEATNVQTEKINVRSSVSNSESQITLQRDDKVELNDQKMGNVLLASILDSAQQLPRAVSRSQIIQQNTARECNNRISGLSVSDSEAGMTLHIDNKIELLHNKEANILPSSISEIALCTVDSTDLCNNSRYSLRSKVLQQATTNVRTEKTNVRSLASNSESQIVSQMDNKVELNNQKTGNILSVSTSSEEVINTGSSTSNSGAKQPSQTNDDSEAKLLHDEGMVNVMPALASELPSNGNTEMPGISMGYSLRSMVAKRGKPNERVTSTKSSTSEARKTSQKNVQSCSKSRIKRIVTEKLVKEDKLTLHKNADPSSQTLPGENTVNVEPSTSETVEVDNVEPSCSNVGENAGLGALYLTPENDPTNRHYDLRPRVSPPNWYGLNYENKLEGNIVSSDMCIEAENKKMEKVRSIFKKGAFTVDKVFASRSVKTLHRILKDAGPGSTVVTIDPHVASDGTLIGPSVFVFLNEKPVSTEDSAMDSLVAVCSNEGI